MDKNSVVNGEFGAKGKIARAMKSDKVERLLDSAYQCLRVTSADEIKLLENYRAANDADKKTMLRHSALYADYGRLSEEQEKEFKKNSN